MAFMNAMTLGAIISVTTGNSVAALRGLGSAFGQVTSASGKLANKLGSVATSIGALGAAGAAFTAGIGLMSSSAADFEAQMSTVGAVMLKGRSEIGALEAKAKQLGATTVFSATQAAEGMELMARAGFSEGDILGGIDGVLNAAAASGMTLAETANHVSNVLKGMGMETSEASRVADVLALASSRTNSTIGSLGESMKNVASTAREFNIPLEEVVAGVALLQDVGLDASVAGSAMNTMLTRMAKISPEMAAKMNKLGVSFQDAQGNMLPFQQVMDQLSTLLNSTKGNMEAAALTADLFGMRGQKAATNLVELVRAGKFSGLVNELNNAAGAAEKMAKLRLDNLKGQFVLLQSAVEGFAIEAMGPVNDQLKEGTKNVTDLVSAITLGMQGEGVGAAADFGRGLKEGVLAIADGMKWLREQVASVSSMFSEGETNWAKTAGIVTAAIAALIVVLTPVLLAIAAIAAAGFFLGEALIPILIGVAAIIGVIGAAFGLMWMQAEAKGMSFVDMLTGAWLALNIVWQSAKDAFMANWTQIEAAFRPGLDALGQAWDTIMGVFQRGGPETSASFEDIGMAIGTVIAFIAQLVGWVFTGIAYFVKWGAAVMVRFAEPMMNAMDLIIGGFLDLITGADTLQSSLGRIFFGIAMAITAHIRGAINSILEMVKILMGNPATQALAKLLGVDTDAAISAAQGFIAEPPMPDWMEPQEKAATLSSRIMELMGRQGADVATPPDPEVSTTIEDKRCLHIDNKLSVDGREAAIATSMHHQDIADRTGAVSTPWQRRQILEHGAAVLAQ